MKTWEMFDGPPDRATDRPAERAPDPTPPAPPAPPRPRPAPAPPNGHELAAAGADQAAAHADQAHALTMAGGPPWSDRAYALLLTFARAAPQFQTEDVRKWAHTDQGLPLPPDGRAWGHVIRRAITAGLLERIGYAPMKSPNCHANPKAVWRWKV